MQEQALRKAAELQHQAAKSAKEGLAGARLVAADIARGDAKSAGGRVGGWAHRATTSAGMLYVARLLVSMGRGKGADKLSHGHRHALTWASMGLGRRGNSRASGAAHPGAPCHPRPCTHRCLVATHQVCLYFVNGVYDKLDTWQFMRQPEVLARARRWPQHYPRVGCGPPRASSLAARA